MMELPVAEGFSKLSIAEKYLDDTDIPCMIALKRWLLDELKRPPESVVGIDIDTTMLEMPSIDGHIQTIPARKIPHYHAHV